MTEEFKCNPICRPQAPAHMNLTLGNGDEIRYIFEARKTEDGAAYHFWDMKQIDDKSEDKKMTEEEWQDFMHTIVHEIKVFTWDSFSVDDSLPGDKRWDLSLLYDGGSHVEFTGSNAYPENWNDFVNVLAPYVGGVLS